MNDELKPADALAARTFTPTGGTAQADSEAQAAEQQQNSQAEGQFLAMAERGLMGALALLRHLGSIKLPPLKETIPDAALADVAKCAMPVIGERLSALLAMANMTPQTAALVASLVPIGVGIVQAIEIQRRTVDVQAREVTPVEPS